MEQDKQKHRDTHTKDWTIAISAGLGMLGFGAWGLKVNNDEVMRSFIAQAPGILGVLLIARLFLSHMNRRENQYNETMTNLATDCHAVHQRAITSIDKNTLMMGRSMKTMDHLDRQLGVNRKQREINKKQREVDSEDGKDFGP